VALPRLWRQIEILSNGQFQFTRSYWRCVRFVLTSAFDYAIYPELQDAVAWLRHLVADVSWPRLGQSVWCLCWVKQSCGKCRPSVPSHQCSVFVSLPCTIKPSSYAVCSKYSRTRWIRHLVCSVTQSVVPINSSLLTVTLYSSVITTLVYNDTKYSVPFMTL
jgi:hypothetical protein